MKLKNIILSTAFLIAFSACDDLFEPAVENFSLFVGSVRCV